MLSPRYLAGISDEIAEIYAQLENDILADMARRIARLGKRTAATDWQAQLLAETGALKKDVARILRKYDPAVQKEIKAIYNDAMIKNARADNRIFTEALGHGVSDINAQIMLAGIQKTHSDISRLTITTAYTTEQMFVQQANAAYMQVVTGAFDYDTAIRQAVDNMAAKGITSVFYNNSKPLQLTIENAVRMNVLTGINQTAAAMTENNCDFLDCDLVEVTAHVGARPTHEAWQGGIYSRSGTSKKYPPFSICELGAVDGICGINCKHSFYPYFEGYGRHYTAEDLEDMTKETVEYNGKKYTRYDAEQELRRIERNVRHYKRRAVTEDAAGLDNTAARVKIGEWQAKANDFTKITGIARDRERELVGTSNGMQPRSISPAAAEYSKNAKLATEIKRLDRARNKVIAGAKQGAPMNFRQADGLAPNPNYKLGGNYRINCQSTVVAYEMRRRGFNVETMPNFAGSMSEVLSHDTSLAWVDRATGKKPAYITPNVNRGKKLLEYLLDETEKESRYTIEFTWKNGNSGHIIHYWKNEKNIISLYDPQTGINLRGNDAALEYFRDIKPTTAKLLNVEKYDINLNVVNKILKARPKK